MSNLALRYTRAVGSGNLRNDELHFDADVLMAVALSSTYGGLLYRAKYFNDEASYRRLRDQWTWIVTTKALRRNWPEEVGNVADKVARISLKLWCNNVCPACTGRKKETIFNTPSLSAKDCNLCNGAGTMEVRCDPRLRDYVLSMIDELYADEYKAGARAKKKLQSNDAAVRAYMPAQKSA